jgi:hypothetical protein
MSRHAKGTILEKTRHYERAIREYRAGKKMVEIHLGQGHQFFAMLSSAMGGARLRAKTMGENSEVKNHIRKKVTSINNPTPDKSQRTPKARKYSVNKE